MNLHHLLRATTNSHASRLGWPRRVTVLDSGHATHVLLGKPAQAILITICLALMPLLIPPLGRLLSFKGQRYQAILPNPRELISFRARTAPLNVMGASEVDLLDVAADRALNPTDECAAQLIDDPAHALDQFYSALARTDAKEAGAITRITHYGDSPITNDGITGTARRLLQERFGDAGHGFILVDRPWAWYGHQAVTFSSSGSWGDDSLMNPMTKDGCFGLGGVTFHATAGRSARFAPAENGDTGKNLSRLDVYYLQQPGGGDFSVSVNGSNPQTASTNSDAVRSGFYQVKAANAGANAFELKTLSGNVRMFGAVLENDGPGVVYDSLGVNGAYAGLLARVMNPQHWAEQLQHRDPNLVILNYGTNESEYASDDQLARYEKELREVIVRVRAALPGVSILLVSPMDRGRHAPGGGVTTLESIPKIVEMQHRVARESNCGFLNMLAAMGGEGTMARWHTGKNHLVGGDLTHPTADGAQAVGVILYGALVEGYAQYRARTAVAAARTDSKRK
jgi:lysophospholipase L1-like esterase